MTRVWWRPLAAAAVVCALGCPEGGDPESDTGRDDGGVDAGRDSGPRDGGDPLPDGPPEPTCDLGRPCTSARGCTSSPRCMDEESGTLGGPDDPIADHPAGDTSVPVTTWVDGYCTQVGTLESGGCDPDDDGSCGCGVCLVAGRDPAGATVTLCAAGCDPAVDENDCRDGYECVLGTGACLPGCSSDDECAVHRTADGLVYDVEGGWTCNPTTYRCEHVPPDGAEAGDRCDRDSQCELFGRCIDEADFPDWTEGYCLKSGCAVRGNECAGSGVCDSRAFGSAACLAPCEVGATAPADDPFAPARDCRAGYACLWRGTAGDDNGVCVPGRYNDVRTANVGASCDATGDAAECYSPYGLGTCRDWDGAGPGGGYCTLFDCGAPGVDSETVCGEGALCAGVATSDSTLCLATCAGAADCEDGWGCWDTTPAGISTGGRRVCFAGCLADEDCRAGESCAGVSTTSIGECTPS